MEADLDKGLHPAVKPSVFSAMRDWIGNQISAHKFTQRFDECDSSEIDAIAKDLGVSRDELRRMAKLGPDAANLLSQRLAALHLDAGDLAKSRPGVMRDLQRLCSQCASKGQCKRDLAFNSDDQLWRDYCPNEGTLTALQSDATGDKID